MALTTYGSLPSELQAGDTYVVEETNSTYPASSWRLWYSLLKHGLEPINLGSTADGDTHDFTLTPVETTKWKPGIYSCQKYVVRNSDQARITLTKKTVTIRPDFTKNLQETHAQKALRLIEERIEGRLTDEIESYSIAGTSITKMSSDDLMNWKKHFRVEVQREATALGLDAGQGSKKRYQVRFRR